MDLDFHFTYASPSVHHKINNCTFYFITFIDSFGYFTNEDVYSHMT